PSAAFSLGRGMDQNLFPAASFANYSTHQRQTTTRTLTRRTAGHLLLTYAAIVLGSELCWGGTTYVISTDDQFPNFPAGYLQAIGASDGVNTPGFVFLSPS